MGKLRQNKKLLMIMVLGTSTLSILLSGCGAVDQVKQLLGKTNTESSNTETSEENTTEAVEDTNYELKGITRDKIEDGVFYVKDDDLFYELPMGETNIPEENRLTDEVDNSRIISFTKDDTLIPTLYKDTKLIYQTKGSIPTFTWERLYDGGYSLGMFLMKDSTSGNVHFVVGTSKTNHQSSAYELLSKLDLANTEITIDKINNNLISSDMLSPGGGLLGLNKDEECVTDLYLGTRYIQAKLVADTHILSSIDVVTSAKYRLNSDGYAEVTIPKDLQSGYYLMDGMGVVRYVKGEKAKGYNDVDFNVDPSEEDVTTEDTEAEN